MAGDIDLGYKHAILKLKEMNGTKLMNWAKLSTIKTIETYKRLLFRQCFVCHSKSQAPLCEHCQPGFQINSPCCQHCKIPLNTADLLCGGCQVLPPPYQNCIAPYRFDGIMKNLIHRIKFHQENHFIRPITYLLSKHLINFYSDKTWPDQLIYVPSHPDRIRERGFCQTQIMSDHLTQYINELSGNAALLNNHSNPIRKSINTHAQHTLTKKERQKSPLNTYEVIHPIPQHIALFDDVMTTGSTIHTCCKLLQKGGAKQIDVWVLARTPDHESKLDYTPFN